MGLISFLIHEDFICTIKKICFNEIEKSNRIIRLENAAYPTQSANGLKNKMREDSAESH